MAAMGIAEFVYGGFNNVPMLVDFRQAFLPLRTVEMATVSVIEIVGVD